MSELAISENTALDVENGVLRGRRGQLFLAGGAHDVLALATGQRAVSPVSIDNFRANIAARASACRAAGAGYLHVIYPDKQSVLQDDFPLAAHPIARSYLEAASGVDARVLFPVDLLRAMPPPAFQRVDTHLTDAGIAHVAHEIARQLLGVAQLSGLAELLATITRLAEGAGDLGSKLSPPETERMVLFAVDWNAASFSNRVVDGNNGVADIYFNPLAPHPGRLLFFGDSFGRSTSFALSFFFSEIVFLRTPFLHDEIVRGMAPDYVVTGNVERYLSYVAPDALAPPFLLYPHLNGLAYAPDQGFARAFAAVLSYGKPAYRTFIAELAGRPPGGR